MELPTRGIAPGVDRIVMLLASKQNIREVTLFPMNQNAQDLMMKAPSKVDNKQLKELELKLIQRKINFSFSNLFSHQINQLIFPHNCFEQILLT